MNAKLLTRRRQPARSVAEDPKPRVAPPDPVRPDVERVGAAIRGDHTRRAVVRSAVWSVPVIAAATAAPSFAASAGTVCTACTGANPTSCAAGACTCGTGLVCAAVGPLNLVSVCVGTGLLSTSCGPTTCTGICVAAGGGVITAVNVLVATLTTALAPLALLPGCNAGVTGFIPGNICTVPVTDVNAGTFGALCITNNGTGLIGGTASTAVNTLKATVAALGVAGLVFANQCASPYACRAGVSASASPAGTPLGCGLGNSLALTVGFCQC